MKKLSTFQKFQLSTQQLNEVKGGTDCHDSYSRSEVIFLRDANNWSESRAKRVLYLSCLYAATAY